MRKPGFNKPSQWLLFLSATASFSVTVPLRAPRLLYVQTLLMTPDQAVDLLPFCKHLLDKIVHRGKPSILVWTF